MRAPVAIASMIALSAGLTAQAAEPAYLGAWKITSAVVAPWADRAHLGVAEKTALVGQTITLTPAAILGPQPFACKSPHYRLNDATADLLFQGELGELQQANPKLSAQSLAASLGFVGKSWKVLDTGCEIDWHFVDPHTVEIGLNDFVYTLRKP
jgi:hypothetical protein